MSPDRKAVRLVVLFMLLLGFFGPWTQVASCGEAPHTVTGVQYVQFEGEDLGLFGLGFFGLFIVPPVLIFFAMTLLRLSPWRIWNSRVVIWLERIGAAGSLIIIGFLVFLEDRILWGLWVTVASVYLALVNLVMEIVESKT